MDKAIQIRNVPEAEHRVLKVRAAQLGVSLSEYLLREIRKIVQRPTLEELLEAIQSDGTVRPKEDSAAAVRAERRSR